MPVNVSEPSFNFLKFLGDIDFTGLADGFIIYYDAANVLWKVKAENTGGTGSSVWGGITGTLSDQTDLNLALSGKSDTSHDHSGVYEPADGTILKDADIGVTVAAQHSHPYAADNHDHSGVYEPADGTILKDADIGVTVAAQHSHPYAADNHDHSGVYEPADGTILKDADIGVTVAAQHSHPYAADNHDHSGVYEPADGTILKDADIGVTVAAQHSHPYAADNHDHSGVYEPADGTILKDADIGVTVAAQTDAFTDEKAQDAVGGSVGTGLQYDDPTGAISTKTQMSITSDASGIKLEGDSASPGNNKVYGTNASGVKGFKDDPAGTGGLDITALTATTDALDGANDAFSIWDNSAGEERKISPDNLAKGTRTMFIPAGAMIPSKTNGALYASDYEATTNKQSLQFFDFSASVAQSVEFGIAMPIDWDGGYLQYKVFWTCTGGASGGTAYWGLQGRCYADDDAIDQSYGSATFVTDDWIANYDMHISAKSGDLSLNGNNAGGNLAWFKFLREAANSTDDLSVVSRLIGVMLYYGVNKWSEA